jgi:hypothetical protein
MEMDKPVKPLRSTFPPTTLLGGAPYVPADKTDIRATFARARRRIAERNSWAAPPNLQINDAGGVEGHALPRHQRAEGKSGCPSDDARMQDTARAGIKPGPASPRRELLTALGRVLIANDEEK